MNLSELLSKAGLSYEELNRAETDTLNQWLQQLESKTLTVEDIKIHLRTLIDALEREMTDLAESRGFWSWRFNKRKDMYLKARLKNYLVLYDLVMSPERARRYVEQQLKNIKQ